MANSNSANNVVPQNRMIEEQSEEVNLKIGYNRGKVYIFHYCIWLMSFE
jgi:hypothetical protein